MLIDSYVVVISVNLTVEDLLSFFVFCSDNTKKNFEQKMQQLVNLVAKTVGLPSTANNVRKYFFNKVKRRYSTTFMLFIVVYKRQ